MGIFFLVSFHGKAQKQEEDGFTVILKQYAEGQTAVVCGPNKITYGAMVQVRSKDDLKGIYYLSMIYMNEKQYILMVKNKSRSLVNPMLVYETVSGTFEYLKDDVVLDKAIADLQKPMQEQILTGMLLWLQVKKKLKAEQ